MLLNDLKLVKNDIDNTIIKKTISLNTIIFIFKRLSTIIPLFFTADEIQEFQKLIFRQSRNESNEQETALHYFTRILKGLMNSKILLVLSGTRYHILSQIGDKIGSPIRQKVKPLIIQKFEESEVNAYIEQVGILLKDANAEQEGVLIPEILENYKTFLFAFSGGHP
ncbi:MAG: hypothetical protein ACTSUT_07705, partial [Promethearchaeota archaeon]